MYKYTLLALTLLIALFPLSGVIAQTGPQIYCGDLSTADCDILRQSRETMRNVETMGFSLNLDYTMSGLGDMTGMDELSFSILLDGVLDVPLAEWYRMYSTSPEAMAEMLPNYATELIDLLRDTNGEASIELVFPPSLSAGMPEMRFDIVLLDGVIYIDTAPLSGLSRPSWIGMDFATMYESLFTETMSEMQGMDLSTLMGTNMFRNMTDPEYMGRFRTLSRADNGETQRQATAVFENTFDLGAMFTDEQYLADYREYMETAMGEQGFEDLGMDIDTFMNMLTSLYQDVAMSYSTWVGLDDYYIHRADVSMDMTFNMNDFMAFADVPSTPGLPEVIDMNMDLTFLMRDFNEPVEIEAPPNATMIDPFSPMGSSL